MLFIGLGVAGLGLSLLIGLDVSMNIEQPLQKRRTLKANILCNFASTLEICDQIWDYRDPDADWPESECRTGSFQSPINIDPSTAKKKQLPFLKRGLNFSQGYRGAIQLNY